MAVTFLGPAVIELWSNWPPPSQVLHFSPPTCWVQVIYKLFRGSAL